MKIFTKFDYNAVCKKVLEEKLDQLGAKYRVVAFGEVEFLEKIPAEKMKEFRAELEEYGISIIENQKTVLIEKIKEAILEMVHSEEPINVKASVYLTDKLNHSYGYLSNLFSEVTFSSIENYIMMQKIEHAIKLQQCSAFKHTVQKYYRNYSFSVPENYYQKKRNCK